MFGNRRDAWLWIAFVGLFAIVAGASIAPVAPIVGVFPFWSLLVLLACLLTVVIGIVAVRRGWPTEVADA